MWGSSGCCIGTSSFFFSLSQKVQTPLSFQCLTILHVIVTAIPSIFLLLCLSVIASNVSVLLYLFFSLLFSLCFLLGVGQRGVVVYHGLAWVRAAVVRPVERAAETPALCAPSRRSVSNHGNHFIYQDQSASTQKGHKRSGKIMRCWKMKSDMPSFASFETGSQAFAHFALCWTQFASKLPNTNVCAALLAHIVLRIYLGLKIPHMVQPGQEAFFSWPCFFFF